MAAISLIHGPTPCCGGLAQGQAVGGGSVIFPKSAGSDAPGYPLTHGTPVSDAGLKELAGFGQLKMLYLQHTAIADRGLRELAVHKQLRTLWLEATKVTDLMEALRQSVEAAKKRRAS